MIPRRLLGNKSTNLVKISKLNLYSTFNVLSDASSVNKSNLYAVANGIDTGSLVNKINLYAVVSTLN